MKLLRCDIKDLRNIKDTKIEFSDGLNLIRGNNAQGKTTVLEAVYVFARGRSFRTNKEAEFISFDSETSDIGIEYEDRIRKNSMSAHYSRTENRKLYKNGIQIKKTSEFIGNFRAVLFTPDHLSLIKSAASDRRLFLDVALSQIAPSYINRVKTYNNLLTQRNALLKDRYAEDGRYKELFETIAEQMAPAAAAITVMRHDYCKKLDGHVDGYFDQMTDGAERTVPAGTQIRLAPGESLHVSRRLYHEFTVEPGTGAVLLGEVSQCNDDNADNRFNPPVGRFPTIEEDEPPYRLLCGEYPPAP